MKQIANPAQIPKNRNAGRIFNRSVTISQIIDAPAGRSLREIGNLIYEPGAAIPYRLYYSAFPPPYSETGQVEIWMATSLDGTAWTNGTAPIITSRYLEDPYVLKTPLGWELYAEDKTAQPQKYIRVFRSPDGLSDWTDLGNAGIPTGGAGAWNAVDVSSPLVWYEGTRRYCLYEGRTAGQDGAIGLAFTDNPDPTAPWTVANGGNPVAIGYNPTFFGAAVPTVAWSKILVPDDLIRAGGTYFLLCHGYTLSNRFVPLLLASTDLINWKDLNGHECYNPDSINAPAETWMFGDALGHTVYFTDSSQAAPTGIKLAATKFEPLRRVNLIFNAGIPNQRVYLPPGPQALLSLKVDGGGVWARGRFKDFGDGEGGFVQFGAADFSQNAFPLYLDVPSSGPGRVMDLSVTPAGGGPGLVFAQLVMF